MTGASVLSLGTVSTYVVLTRVGIKRGKPYGCLECMLEID